jgi:integrase
MDAYRAERSVERKPKTIYSEGMTIKRFLAWCKSRNLVVNDPLANWRLKKPPRTLMPVPPLQELSEIIHSCTPINRQRLTILSMTGMRIGELQGLAKANVDFQRGMIEIVGQLDGPTKTKDTRAIPIHPQLKPILAKLVGANDHRLLVTALPSAKYPDGGHRISDKKLNLAMKKATATVTDLHYTLHSCRRFFNTHCINQGIPERVVRVWMGHHDRSMTEVYYALSTDESSRFMRQVDFGEIGSL